MHKLSTYRINIIVNVDLATQTLSAYRIIDIVNVTW